MKEEVLLVGVSTRAAATSAARAGYRVHTVDAYADLDQHPDVNARAVPRGFGPRAAVRTAAKLRGTVVAYLSPFENHPAQIGALTTGRVLWGNSPAVVHAVRDPVAVVEAARRYSLPAPRLGGSGADRWLMKPLASGGGHGIREWRPGMRLRRRHYLQEYLDGTLASIAFLANRRDAVVVGITRQLSGLDVFGATPYQYCGSIFDPAMLDASIADASRRLAATMTREFGLVGVNVLDVMLCDGVPYVLEINPRWSASLELLEAVGSINLFAAHADACTNGSLPAAEPPWRLYPGASGKAIVYARAAATAAATEAWLEDGIVRDVPRPGTRINRAAPICTVTASARDLAGCLAALEARAAGIHDALRPVEESAA